MKPLSVCVQHLQRRIRFKRRQHPVLRGGAGTQVDAAGAVLHISVVFRKYGHYGKHQRQCEQQSAQGTHTLFVHLLSSFPYNTISGMRGKPSYTITIPYSPKKIHPFPGDFYTCLTFLASLLSGGPPPASLSIRRFNWQFCSIFLGQKQIFSFSSECSVLGQKNL